jgi:hypothetical protein
MDRLRGEFQQAGWALSSATLKVPYATSPDGRCRVWFKAQSVYWTHLDDELGDGKHNLNNAHSATQTIDIRKVAPGKFVPWFTQHFCNSFRKNPNYAMVPYAGQKIRVENGTYTVRGKTFTGPGGFVQAKEYAKNGHLRKNPSTPAFRSWFGKSILKDDNGEPTVFYHGSPNTFNEIDTGTWGKGKDALGSGFYLTTDPGDAHGYGSNVIQAYVRLEKPLSPKGKKPLSPAQIKILITSSPLFEDRIWNFGDVDYEGMRKVLQNAIKAYQGLPAFVAIQHIQGDFWPEKDVGQYMKLCAKTTGYDGVYAPGRTGAHVVVWDPNQVKYTSNEGNWSRDNNDMRKNGAKKVSRH